ncbi:MAG TPA: aspartate kinase [Flavisolibacter sp.]|jgi:aspartate kinase|nr:aspartate kinase [Flavisolibacter sp.]
MKVFKFGGASVSTIERIRNVGEILQSYKDEKLLVVVSAMGKTTNALEEVTNAFYAGDSRAALQLFNVIKEQHAALATQLIPEPILQLTDFFTEIEWLLHDKPVKNYDYYYDQVVCVGELLSTVIVSHYFNSIGVQNSWVDIRDVMRTDNNFRDAKIDWDVTTEKTSQNIKPLYRETNIVLTQGFIGATDENQSTTLGREGSDYTAAALANILNADSVTIWKDVQGVMNADPKQYEKAQWIPGLNYKEVIEMAYYGAQVIHPKTIKPLQNKGIPLYVKSFINPGADGTVIHSKHIAQLPPILVYKSRQVMMELSSKDFSFVSEGLTGALYQMFDKISFKPNLTQNGAIGFICVVDEHPEKVEQLAHEANHLFDVQIERHLTLLTIRHYNRDIIDELCKDRIVILRQQTRETIQLLMKE